MARHSPDGFYGVILRGKLNHHLIFIGDSHADKINGLVVEQAGVAEPSAPSAPIPVDVPVLAVLHYDADTETATLWLDPPFGGPPPDP